jgi:AraC family transcriptional regulator
MKTRIENKPPLTVLGFSHRGAYHLIGEAFEKLNRWRRESGVEVFGMLGVYHDDPNSVEESLLRSDAVFIVDSSNEAPAGMSSFTLPAARYLVGEYYGSYEGLGVAWNELYTQEVPKNSVIPNGNASFELYVNVCGEVPIEELRTDLFAPVI